MKSPGTYVEREPGSLKEAEAQLVTACGGIDASGKLTRLSRSQIARYTDPSTPEYHMPVDVVVALELHCANPIVTRYLAIEANNVLVAITPGESGSVADHMAVIGKDTGTLYERFGVSIKDGTISPLEAARLRASALKDICALSALIGDLDRMREGKAA